MLSIIGYGFSSNDTFLKSWIFALCLLLFTPILNLALGIYIYIYIYNFFILFFIVFIYNLQINGFKSMFL